MSLISEGGITMVSMKSRRSVFDMMKMQSSNGSTANTTSTCNHTESELNTDDSRPSSVSKGMKQDSFFLKDPKKQKRNQIVD